MTEEKQQTAAAPATIVTDATQVAEHVKSEIGKLGPEVKGLDIRIVAEAKSLWTRYELWIVGVGAAIGGAILAHLV